MKKNLQKDTRRNILETTMRLFSEGIFSPSMAKIATESGISKSALYYFFQDKKDLFAAVSKSIVLDFVREIETIADRNKPADEKVRDFFQFFFSEIEKKKAFSQMIIPQIFSGDSFFLSIVSQKRRAAMTALSEILKSGQDAGIFREFSSDAIAEVIGGILDFLLLFRAIAPLEGASEKCLLCDPQKITEEFLLLLKKE